MPISMSTASLPIFRTMLGNLSHVLDKGLAHAQAHRELADALDGVGEDLGVEGFQLAGALELAHGVLVVVEDDDVHGRRWRSGAALEGHCARSARSFLQK